MIYILQIHSPDIPDNLTDMKMWSFSWLIGRGKSGGVDIYD